MNLTEAIDATARALRDLTASGVRRTLKSFNSFKEWLKNNLPRIHEALKLAQLLLSLYNSVRGIF